MIFRVDTHSAMYHSPDASLREAVRMSSLAWCLNQCGHEVLLTCPVMREWWHGFRMDTTSRPNALLCCPDSMNERPGGYDIVVGMKATGGTAHDKTSLEIADLFVAHIYNDIDPNLLGISLPVHQRTAQLFRDEKLFGDYLSDRLDPIRRAYRDPVPRGVGFVGGGGFGRERMASRLPSWVRCDFHYGEYCWIHDPRAYLKTIGGYLAGVAFPGARPHTYRHSELVVLGVPVVTVPLSLEHDPPLTSSNTILLNDWEDHAALEDGVSRAVEIERHATKDYREGWSVMATARKITSIL